MSKPPKSSQNVSDVREFYVSQTELAKLMGRDERMIRKWETAGVLAKEEKGYPAVASMRAVLDYLCAGTQQKAATAAEKTAEQVRNLRLDAEAKERARKKDEGEWLESAVWLPKIDAHIGDVRQAIKTLLLLEQPATLSGRSEVDIRELNQKTYAALCRRLQNASGRLMPKDAASSEA